VHLRNRADPVVDPTPQFPQRINRRRFLAIGGAGILAAAAGSAIWLDRRLVPEPSVTVAERSFRSTSLRTPALKVTTYGRTGDGLLFLEPQSQAFSGLAGVIMDNDGEPVWIAPSQTNLTDLAVQELDGEPVLTYWSGQVLSPGYGKGVGVILDSSYRRIATVHAGSGLEADLHEFHLTPRGTALMTAFSTVRADLSSVGGPRDGYVLNGHVQEVDVHTGDVLLSWSALDHVPLTDSYLSATKDSGGTGATADAAFDAYHLNSIDFDDDTLYVSSRHTHTIYAIDRSNGEVTWRMGGKRSQFSIADDARFAWQHHVRKHEGGLFTVFNNNTNTQRTLDRSSGLFLNVDETARTVTLRRRYGPTNRLSDAEGSVQPLSNGNVLIGWGTDPFVDEYDTGGAQVLGIEGLGVASYRAFRSPWSAVPATDPDLAVEAAGASLGIFASWNGATDVRSWRILSGSDPSTLSSRTVVARSGFETHMTIPRASFVQAQALNGSRAVVGTSQVVRAG
jgi:hypothetical protein